MYKYVYICEKQYDILCSGCLSVLPFSSLTRNRWGMELIPLPCCFSQENTCTCTNLPRPIKASRSDCYIWDADRPACVYLLCSHTNFTPKRVERGEMHWVLIEGEGVTQRWKSHLKSREDERKKNSEGESTVYICVYIFLYLINYFWNSESWLYSRENFKLFFFFCGSLKSLTLRSSPVQQFNQA